MREKDTNTFSKFSFGKDAVMSAKSAWNSLCVSASRRAIGFDCILPTSRSLIAIVRNQIRILSSGGRNLESDSAKRGSMVVVERWGPEKEERPET